MTELTKRTLERITQILENGEVVEATEKQDVTYIKTHGGAAIKVEKVGKTVMEVTIEGYAND